MASKAAGYDWRLDSPWRRLPLTLPGAVLVGLFGLWIGAAFLPETPPPVVETPPLDARFITLPPPPEVVAKPDRTPPPRERDIPPEAASDLPPATVNTPASLDAPPAPSAEEWGLAATYTLKNSKRYRNNWGQLVRSMMGTAVEGPDQGMVRFRIEIAPDGKVAKIEELWSTSEKASQLAWQAIRNLPPTPPTPTGKPLVFEKTISFLPYETGWPPSYKNDCLPDPPRFNNPFAWDGTSPRPVIGARPAGDVVPDNASSEAECDPTSTADSIEEEEGELRRQMERNRWGR